MVVAKHESSPPANQNPSSDSRRGYHVGGISVEFPYQPYGTQLAFMGRVISTLDRGQREGRCHALLESPTGTGKSLSLLCSTLAWQQTQKLKNQYANLTHFKPDPQAATDPMGHGGGFIPETQPSGNLPPGMMEPTAQPAPGSNPQKKKKVAPTIFYASRTHSQITQVVREYKKTAYRVPMAILASRKRYCTNKTVNQSGNIDEECKLLMKDSEGGGCSYFKNVHKVKGHTSLQKGGCHEVHDIEDLVKIGDAVKGCPYYAARSMAEEAQLVFCPYNYVINPIVRGAMEVDIKGAIIVLDEAHNIEDIARDAGSVDLDEDALQKLQTELGQLCSDDDIQEGQSSDQMIYQPLYDMTQGLVSWMERKKSTLESRECQQFYSCWTGDQALRELQEANIRQQDFSVLLECALKAIQDATDKEAENALLSGMSVTVLEGLFSALTYFFSRNGSHVADYQLAVQRTVIKDTRNHVTGWTHTFSLWCLNPAVVFKDITDLSLSVILTSGTLSPMNSFPSELGVNFGTCIEAPHVVNIKSQVWTAVISSSPSPENYPLNASYKTASTLAFQDELGKSLEEIFKVVPAGSLVFFPSYSMMGKLCKRWQETGQWSNLHAHKSLFVEPRGGKPEEFDSLLKAYYKSVSGNEKVPVGNKKRNKTADIKKNGAAFLAVCRGKVSEGIDFSDDNARVVIIVGIPFPNINDVKVSLKKKYNDTFKPTKNLISGSDWYCHQAFRALNQAAGRCIRHKNDYGAIILLDERYQEERNIAYISKWLRKSIQHYDSFDESLDGLKSFFRDAKTAVAINTPSPVPTFMVKEEKDITKVQENSPSGESNHWWSKPGVPGQKPVVKEEKDITKAQENSPSGESNHWWSKPGVPGQKLVAAPKLSPSANFDSKGEVEPIIIDDDIESCQVNGLDCDIPKGTGLADGRNLAYISKWLKKPIQLCDSFGVSLDGLKRSFRDAETAVAINSPRLVPSFMVKEDRDISKVQANSCTGESNHRWSKLGYPRQKLVAVPKCSPSANFDSKIDVKPIIVDDDIESCQGIGLDCDSPKGTRLAEASDSLDPEFTVVGETPDMVWNGTPTTGSPEPTSTTAVDCGSSMIQASTEITTTGELTYLVQGSSMCSPEKVFRISTFSPTPEVDAPMVPSVNSRTQKKRRKLMDSALVTPKQEQSDGCNAGTSGCVSLTRSPFSGANSSGSMQQPVSFGPAVEKRLRISCLLCKKPLGRPENDLYIGCLSTSSSKVHLLCLAKEGLESEVETISKSVPLVLADIASVDHHLCDITREDAPSKGIWSEEDGCVFRSVFCPLCSKSHCLGVQVMATDASNVELLNKILLFYDRLEIQTVGGASGDKPSENHKHVPKDEPAAPDPFERFAFSRKSGCVGKPAASDSSERLSLPPQQKTGGWRSAKLSLQKKRSR